MRSTYDLVDFGAVGDGIFDNTLAFQFALNRAKDAGGGPRFPFVLARTRASRSSRARATINPNRAMPMIPIDPPPRYSAFAEADLFR